MLAKGFSELLKKYRDGLLSGEKKDTMDLWYSLLHKGKDVSQNEEEVKERMWREILLRTGGVQEEENQVGTRAEWWRSKAFRVAASVLIVLGASLLIWNYQRESQQPADVILSSVKEWKEFRNDGSGTRELLLSDGSRVVLEPNSSIRFPEEFAAESRSVQVAGNALFEVEKDSLRPFYAFAGEVVVRVLGTSFTIKDLGEHSATEVAVISGKVLVGQHTERSGKSRKEEEIILAPNEKVTFFKNTGRYVTGLVENPVIIGKTEEFLNDAAFDFDEVPLSQILEKLGKAYGVDIQVTNNSLSACLITADLSSESLYGKMDLISAILDADYEVEGNTIFLKGGMCKVLER